MKPSATALVFLPNVFAFPFIKCNTSASGFLARTPAHLALTSSDAILYASPRSSMHLTGFGSVTARDFFPLSLRRRICFLSCASPAMRSPSGRQSTRNEALSACAPSCRPAPVLRSAAPAASPRPPAQRRALADSTFQRIAQWAVARGGGVCRALLDNRRIFQPSLSITTFEILLGMFCRLLQIGLGIRRESLVCTGP